MNSVVRCWSPQKHRDLIVHFQWETIEEIQVHFQWETIEEDTGILDSLYELQIYMKIWNLHIHIHMYTCVYEVQGT